MGPLQHYKKKLAQNKINPTINCNIDMRQFKVAKKIDEKLELNILVKLVTLSETGHDVHLKSDALKALMDV